jgi:hypothetical protein
MGRRITARVLDGTKTRDQDLAEPKDEIERPVTEGICPDIAAVLIGEILPPTPMSKA